MAGFYVFQGVRWWPWLMLFTAFLPWNRRDVAPAGTGSRDLTSVHARVVLALVAAQAWASYRAIEIEPLLSNYPMYASTYESPEYFERAHARVRFEVAGTDVTDRVETARGAETLQATVVQPGQQGTQPSAPTPALTEFRERYARLCGDAPGAIDVVLLKRPFDWTAGEYTTSDPGSLENRASSPDGAGATRSVPGVNQRRPSPADRCPCGAYSEVQAEDITGLSMEA